MRMLLTIVNKSLMVFTGIQSEVKRRRQQIIIHASRDHPFLHPPSQFPFWWWLRRVSLIFILLFYPHELAAVEMKLQQVNLRNDESNFGQTSNAWRQENKSSSQNKSFSEMFLDHFSADNHENDVHNHLLVQNPPTNLHSICYPQTDLRLFCENKSNHHHPPHRRLLFSISNNNENRNTNKQKCDITKRQRTISREVDLSLWWSDIIISCDGDGNNKWMRWMESKCNRITERIPGCVMMPLVFRCSLWERRVVWE